jgi:hypothetical protein
MHPKSETRRSRRPLVPPGLGPFGRLFLIPFWDGDLTLTRGDSTGVTRGNTGATSTGVKSGTFTSQKLAILTLRHKAP